MSKRDLPLGLRQRKQNSGKVHFYLKTAAMQKESPLGPHLEAALVAWRNHMLELYPVNREATRILTVLGTFRLVEIPIRDTRSRPALQKQISALENFFMKYNNPELTAMWPATEAYFDFRGHSHELRAGAEIRCLIHVWGWAQKLSLIAPNQACPWVGKVVGDRVRLAVRRELCDALLNIAGGDDFLLHAQPAADERPAPALPPHLVPVHHPAADLTRHTRFATQTHAGVDPVDISFNEAEATSFLRLAAERLTWDGRPDLAREARRLHWTELQAILSISRTSATSLPSGAKLVLRTQRSARLTELRRVRTTRARRE